MERAQTHDHNTRSSSLTPSITVTSFKLCSPSGPSGYLVQEKAHEWLDEDQVVSSITFHAAVHGGAASPPCRPSLSETNASVLN